MQGTLRERATAPETMPASCLTRNRLVDLVVGPISRPQARARTNPPAARCPPLPGLQTRTADAPVCAGLRDGSAMPAPAHETLQSALEGHTLWLQGHGL
jgi:hypothetical protein